MKKLISIVLLCSACLDPYLPPASSTNLDALVVDGLIDVNGTASVILSRSIPLDGKNPPEKETGAVVTIESSDGEKLLLNEDAAGSYSLNGITVDRNSKYTLHIVTAEDKDYRSDPVSIHNTPPVDSIYWTVSASGKLDIRADSHNTDPNSTGYYLLNAIETYEYHADINAHFKFVNRQPVERLPEEEVYYCYSNERTPNVIASTKGLTEDRLSGVKITTIERSSPKISMRYSILVKQFAIGDDEFNYQKLLQASTEQQASLYAQIPGRVTGNVHSTKDPDEYVLGYFSGRNVKELRYFIDFFDLPSGFYQRPVSYCQAEPTCFLPGLNLPQPGGCVDPFALSESVGIVTVVKDGAGNPTSYIFATAECTDCTLKGGTTIKPPFW
ncbi:MAG: DUF4249 domain-containing protein [Bacteroidota bacterium]